MGKQFRLEKNIFNIRNEYRLRLLLNVKTE